MAHRMAAATAAARTTKAAGALSWDQLHSATAKIFATAWTPECLSTGPATSYARLRLFGDTKAKDVRVTLYRDNHACGFRLLAPMRVHLSRHFS